MRLIRSLLLLLCVLGAGPGLIGLADAQFHHVYTPAPSGGGGGGGYNGPVDAAGTPATWCFSFARGCTAGYSTGSNIALSLQRASDSHTCNVNVSTTGGLTNTVGCGVGGDNGQSLSTWLSGTTGTVSTPYDQSGNGNNPAGTSGYSLSCTNSMPCGTFNGSTQGFVGGSFSTSLSQPVTLAVVFYVPSSVSSIGGIMATGGNVSIAQADTGDCSPLSQVCALGYSGYAAQPIALTTNAWHSLILVANGASSTYNLDCAGPVTVTNNMGTTGIVSGQPFTIGQIYYGYQYYTGSIAEGMLFPVGLTSGEQTALGHNMRLAYSLSGSC